MGLFEKSRDELEGLKSQQRAAAGFWAVFTPAAQQALALAREEAGRMGHSFIGPEHLLLGLLGLEHDGAGRLLHRLGISAETVRAAVMREPGAAPAGGGAESTAPSPQLMRVLAAAKQNAMALRHSLVGTEHVLLALLDEPDGAIHDIFHMAGTDRPKAREELLAQITQPNRTSQQEQREGA